MPTFQDQILSLVAASFENKPYKQRDFEIAMKHYGWDGAGGLSLQQTGTAYGLTRERVRQIASQFAERMAPLAHKHLTLVEPMMEHVLNMEPASTDRMQRELAGLGLGEDRIEGLLKAASIYFNTGNELRIFEELGGRYLGNPNFSGRAGKVLALAQKGCSHHGMINIESLTQFFPELSEPKALAFVQDILSSRADTVWLNEDKNWIWMRNAPRNRLITCISKMLSIFSSTTVQQVLDGANRYFRKGKGAVLLEAPLPVMQAFLESWEQTSVSPTGVVRKTKAFSPTGKLLETEKSIVEYICSKPEKMAREKELENALVPVVDNQTHPKKYNFSISLNYSPLISKGSSRGEYVANGQI